MLTAFSWPGNVRQLEQAVMAALTICESDQIQPRDFPAWFLTARQSDFEYASPTQTATSDHRAEKIYHSGVETYSDQERQSYLDALDSTKYSGTGRWNLSAAARKLGVPRKTFIYRLKKMKLIR
jgi:transcriptional regulator of acetoin/glycerol metabolism